MGKTITANSGPIKLTSTHAAYNPLAINAAVTVAGTSYGVYGDNSQAWTVTNSGTISASTGNGVYFKAGGLVTNSGSASRIAGATHGIMVVGSAGTISNAGSISGTFGLYLKAGGTVTNSTAQSAISGVIDGVLAILTPASVFNSGSISGGSYGIVLGAGGVVTNNTTSANITGSRSGIMAAGSAATVINQGTIAGGTTAVSTAGVYLKAGGSVANSGGIYGRYGILANNNPATITNQGTVSGLIGGIYLDGGALTNAAFALITASAGEVVVSRPNTTATFLNRGTITGAHIGINADAGSLNNQGTNATIHASLIGVNFNKATSITNDGTISGNQFNGIGLGGGGVVLNTLPSAVIAGQQYGIAVGNGAATISNRGTISGTTAAVAFANANGNLLQEFPGGVFAGAVKGGSGEDTLSLEFGDPSSAIISGIGSKFTGFEQLYEVADMSWRMTGINTVGSSMTMALGQFSTLSVVGTLLAPANLTVRGAGTLGVGSTGRIHVGTAPQPVLAGQIAVDFGHTFRTGGALSAHSIRNHGTIAALYGYGDAVRLPGAASVYNSNQISGGRAGVSGIGALSVNNNLGTIAGGVYGIYGAAATTITNNTKIAGAAVDGVHLAAGGTVLNNGVVTGGQNGVYATAAPATVTNLGYVGGTAGYGVFLGAGGSVTNGNSTLFAIIYGGASGIGAQQARLTVSNYGSIAGNQQYGIALLHGGAITNSHYASISGGAIGIADDGAALTIVNQGTIGGTAEYGVSAASAAVITNSGIGAHITGGFTGLSLRGGKATISNAGTISGLTLQGIILSSGGTVTNAGTAALISGNGDGIDTGTAASTIINHGTISGGTGAAVQFGAATGNLFRSFPGAVTNGAVVGGTAQDTLELASAASAGTITGLGTAFTGFEKLLVDAGAVWKAAGANTLQSTATLALVGNASLGVSGALIAPGNLTITGAGTLSANGGSIEIGTTGGALANQIVVDGGHTLTPAGVLNASALVVASSGLVVGAGTIAAPVANSGKVQSINGTLTISGNLTGGTVQATSGSRLILKGGSNAVISALGAGTFEIGAADSLDITGSVDPTSTALFILNSTSLLEINADPSSAGAISFLGSSGGRLVVDDVAHFGTNVGLGTYKGPLLENFDSPDTIDLKNLLFSGATIDGYTAATGLLQMHSGSTKATLLFQNASLGSGSFHLAADSGTGTLLAHS